MCVWGAGVSHCTQPYFTLIKSHDQNRILYYNPSKSLRDMRGVFARFAPLSRSASDFIRATFILRFCKSSSYCSKKCFLSAKYFLRASCFILFCSAVSFGFSALSSGFGCDGVRRHQRAKAG